MDLQMRVHCMNKCVKARAAGFPSCELKFRWYPAY
jgi:hypothetical protein